jgi:asparagine N-glycosylation enzyme membrane subunit Stt3
MTARESRSALAPGGSNTSVRNATSQGAGARIGAPLGLFLLSFAVRSLPFPTVRVGDSIHFLGMDAYYHMRRIAYGLERFPETLVFDPYINFPAGATAIWPPLFDVLCTWLAFPFHAAGGIAAAEQALVWVPPLFGAGTVVLAYCLALRFLGLSAALFSGVFLALSSGHAWYSQVGFLDHHAAVAFATTALLYAGMATARDLALPSARLTRSALGLGVALGANLLLWPGSLLHVGIVIGALGVWVLGQPQPAAAERGARTLALASLVALLVVAPFSWSNDWARWGAFTPTVLSRFQPWFFAVLAVGFAILTQCAKTRFGPRGKPRPLPGLLVAIGLLGLSAVCLPGLREGLADAWQWLAKDEAFQASVLESRPLFSVRGQWSSRIAEGRLSYLIYLLPATLLYFAYAVRNREDRSALRLLLIWTLVLAAVTLLQRRFFNSFSVALSLVMGWGFAVAVGRSLGTRASSLRRIGIAAAVGLSALYLLSPMGASFRPSLDNLQRAFAGRPVLKRSAGPDFEALFETAAWIREHTPSTRGYRDASLPPEYGLITLPGIGHLFEYRAERPVVADNFGDDIGIENYALVRRYFSSLSQEEAAEIASDLRARYVVATAPAARQRGGTGIPLLERLAHGDGQGLGSHRLVFEASRLGVNARTNRPPPKVFEHVRGARVEGLAPAQQNVSARIDVETNRGRRFVYRQSVRSDDQGRYRLQLPYASEARNGASKTGSAWRIDSGGASHPLSILESAVRTGGVVPGPDFGS